MAFGGDPANVEMLGITVTAKALRDRRVELRIADVARNLDTRATAKDRETLVLATTRTDSKAQPTTDTIFIATAYAVQ
jgi:hypothetical protein